MIDVRQSERRAKIFGSAFTLIEIVVALTIVTVITAMVVPTVKGLDRDEKARAPIKALAELVQQVRQHAMRERQAYQIVFEREGLHASPTMFPYEKRDEFLKQLEQMRTPPKIDPIERVTTTRVEVQRQEVANGRTSDEPASESEKEAPRFELPWTATIPLQQKTECDVLMWGDGDWDVIEGEKMRRWVFQPSGMANPARVRLRNEGGELEAGFDVLTGELRGERIRRNSMQP
jgi:type II secretory pathway pseudopilin PulG